LEENEDNQVAIWVSVPPKDPHYSMKMRMLGGVRQGMQKHRFQIPIDYKEKVTMECFSLLRFAHAKDSELMLLQSGQAEFDIKKIEPISIRNELLVLKHLAKVCTGVAAEFDTTLEQDNKMLADLNLLPMYSNRRNCVLMRRGEKEVCHYYIDLEKEITPLVNMAWKDFKKAATKAYSGKGRFDSYITTVIAPLLKGDH
jgi:hypothetical protein